MGCRNCGAPLPDPAVQPTGACSRCGTLYGGRAELEEYAAAVVSGRPLERPKSIATPRLKVRFHRGTSGDYRTAGSDSSLVITLRYFNKKSLLALAFGLVAIAGLAYIWHLALAGRVYAVATVASVPLGFYLWVRLTSVFDALVIRLSGGQLFCSQSRFWPRMQTKLSAADVVQLYTVQTGRAFSLFARKKDGKAALLVRGMGDAELGVYLERQLEAAIGLADQPVQGELPRKASLPKRAPRVRGAFIELAVLAVLVVGPVFGIRACGTSVTGIDVGDHPRETTFELDKAKRVFFTSDIELAHDNWRSRNGIPKVLTFDIDIVQNGRSVSRLGCDPFAVFAWVSSSHNHYVDSFWGPMDDCAVKLAPGRYTLRAVRRWQPNRQGVELERSMLGLRTD